MIKRPISTSCQKEFGLHIEWMDDDTGWVMEGDKYLFDIITSDEGGNSFTPAEADEKSLVFVRKVNSYDKMLNALRIARGIIESQNGGNCPSIITGAIEEAYE